MSSYIVTATSIIKLSPFASLSGYNKFVHVAEGWTTEAFDVIYVSIGRHNSRRRVLFKKKKNT